MLVKLLKSKLHWARVTKTELNYPGSIAIDPELMDAVGLLPYESVLIADINNGNRLETYVIPAEKRGGGDIVVLGAAAKLVATNDIIIIFGFGFFTPKEAKGFKPKIVSLDKNNRIIERVS